jgi:hypothetical protein
MTVLHHLIRWIIEPTDATIIRCIFLKLNQINLNMFRALLCPSSEEQEWDWLKLQVKMPDCAGCDYVEPWWRQGAVFESCCSTCSPDDGHKDARNMLRLIWFKKYTSNYCCICWFYCSPDLIFISILYWSHLKDKRGIPRNISVSDTPCPRNQKCLQPLVSWPSFALLLCMLFVRMSVCLTSSTVYSHLKVLLIHSLHTPNNSVLSALLT